MGTASTSSILTFLVSFGRSCLCMSSRACFQELWTKTTWTSGTPHVHFLDATPKRFQLYLVSKTQDFLKDRVFYWNPCYLDEVEKLSPSRKLNYPGALFVRFFSFRGLGLMLLLSTTWRQWPSFTVITRGNGLVSVSALMIVSRGIFMLILVSYFIRVYTFI